MNRALYLGKVVSLPFPLPSMGFACDVALGAAASQTARTVRAATARREAYTDGAGAGELTSSAREGSSAAREGRLDGEQREEEEAEEGRRRGAHAGAEAEERQCPDERLAPGRLSADHRHERARGEVARRRGGRGGGAEATHQRLRGGEGRRSQHALTQQPASRARTRATPAACADSSATWSRIDAACSRTASQQPASRPARSRRC